MMYKGFFIAYTRGYYTVYYEDDFVCTADTVREAKNEADNDERQKEVIL